METVSISSFLAVPGRPYQNGRKCGLANAQLRENLAIHEPTTVGDLAN